MGSDLVLSVCNTCAGQYNVLCLATVYNVTHNTLESSVKVTDSGPKWPFSRVCVCACVCVCA